MYSRTSGGIWINLKFSAIRALRHQSLGVRALQDYYAGIAAGSI